MSHEKTESVRIDLHLLRLVRVRAAATGRSIKAQIEFAIKQNLARTQPGEK